MVPFPPPWVLWVIIAADLILFATGWRGRRAWAMGAGLALSVYLTITGIFSVGPVTALIALIQGLWLGRHFWRQDHSKESG